MNANSRPFVIKLVNAPTPQWKEEKDDKHDGKNFHKGPSSMILVTRDATLTRLNEEINDCLGVPPCARITFTLRFAFGRECYGGARESSAGSDTHKLCFVVPVELHGDKDRTVEKLVDALALLHDETHGDDGDVIYRATAHIQSWNMPEDFTNEAQLVQMLNQSSDQHEPQGVITYSRYETLLGEISSMVSRGDQNSLRGWARTKGFEPDMYVTLWRSFAEAPAESIEQGILRSAIEAVHEAYRERKRHIKPLNLACRIPIGGGGGNRKATTAAAAPPPPPPPPRKAGPPRECFTDPLCMTLFKIRREELPPLSAKKEKGIIDAMRDVHEENASAVQTAAKKHKDIVLSPPKKIKGGKEKPEKPEKKEREKPLQSLDEKSVVQTAAVTLRDRAVLILKDDPDLALGGHYRNDIRPKLSGDVPNASLNRVLNPNNSKRIGDVPAPWRNRDVVFLGSGRYIHRDNVTEERIPQILDAIPQIQGKTKREREKWEVFLHESLLDGRAADIYDELPRISFDRVTTEQEIRSAAGASASQEVTDHLIEKWREYRSALGKGGDEKKEEDDGGALARPQTQKNHIEKSKNDKIPTAATKETDWIGMAQDAGSQLSEREIMVLATKSERKEETFRESLVSIQNLKISALEVMEEPLGSVGIGEAEIESLALASELDPQIAMDALVLSILLINSEKETRDTLFGQGGERPLPTNKLDSLVEYVKSGTPVDEFDEKWQN